MKPRISAAVAGVQAFDHTAQRATDIANGRAAMPTPGELIGGAAMGAVAMTGQGVDAGIRAVKDGVRAAAEGDIEGIAAAAENGLKATLDVGTVVAGAQGFASGVKSMMGPGGGATSLAAAGAASPLAVGLASPVAAGVGKIGASIGAVGTLSQAPMESRGRGRRSWGKANETRPPRSHEGLVEWPKTKTPDAKPRGPREKIEEKLEPAQKKDLEHQLEATDALAEFGFDVEQLPPKNIRKSPELRLNGEIFDVYSPRADTPIDAVRGHIQNKVADGQTRRVVVNLDQVRIEPRDLSIALDRNRAQHRGLREVIAFYEGKITRIYPRKR
ncbi:MAG: hypothetical protein AAFQ65_15700 [Myxococcota bacterium]